MRHERLMPRLQQILDVRTQSISEELLSFQRANPRGAVTADPPRDPGWLGLSERELRVFSLTDALAALHGLHKPGFPESDVKRWDGSLARDCHQQLAKRAEQHGQRVAAGDLLIPTDIRQRSLSTVPGGKGGYLVGYEPLSYDAMLRARSVASRLGVQFVRGGQNNFAWPKQTGASTATWLTTGGNAPTSAPTYVQNSASPHTLLAFLEVPQSLLTQAGPAGESFILDGLSRDMATGVDLAILAGTGSEQPLGIVNTQNIGTFSGTSLGYAGLLEAQTDVADASAVLNPDTMGYVGPPLTASLLKSRQRFTGTDSPLWKGAIHEGEIEGVRAMSTKLMAANTLLYGDFSACSLIEWGILALQINPFQDFNRGLVGIRAMWMVDVAVRYPLSFSLATAIT